MTRFDLQVPARGLCAALTAVLTAGFLLATPAQAQRTSINSLAADHDDILANQNHGATPIFACMTIADPGAYVVVQDLVAVGDCLTVTADNVIIDLGGHELSGDGTGDGVGTNATVFAPRRNIAVHNGTVSGFGFGINLGSVDSCTIRHIHASQNVGIGIFAGFGCIIAGNTASDNETGIFAQVYSIISGNTATGNSGAGILSQNANTVTGNIASDNGRGISLGPNSTITGNTADFNRGIGIAAIAGSTFIGNTASSNGGLGIGAQAGSTVANNTAQTNAVGIDVVCPSNVIGNTATESGAANLRLNGLGCNSVNNVSPAVPAP